MREPRFKTWRLIVPLGLLLIVMQGCTTGPGAHHSQAPASIGEGEGRVPDGLDAYETAVVHSLNHMEDIGRVLETVDDVESAEHAVGLFDDASDRIVMWGIKMEQEKPNREITAGGEALKYGIRFFWNRLVIERELKRIKAIGPEVHGPIKAALKNLEQRMKDSGVQDPSEGG